MAEETSLIAQQVRLSQWAEQIRNMQGLSAEIFSTVTPELLKYLIEAFGYAE